MINEVASSSLAQSYPWVASTLKIVRLRSFSGLYFRTFALKMKIYSVNLRIQSKCRNMEQKNSEYGHLTQCKQLVKKKLYNMLLKADLRNCPSETFFLYYQFIHSLFAAFQDWITLSKLMEQFHEGSHFPTALLVFVELQKQKGQVFYFINLCLTIPFLTPRKT